MARLRRVDCSGPGIRRRRRGRGFSYLDAHGETVSDRETLSRIADLRIPPAWEDVWVCPHPRGHIQATGLDAAGRKQYLYHEDWRKRRDQEKFDEMTDFAAILPKLRRRIAKDLADSEPTRTRVLAGALHLLDLGFFRVGGEQYAEENQSYGLATIRKSHVRIDNGSVTFRYPAKSGQKRVQEVADPDLVPLIRQLKRRRGGGDELLAYKERGRWHDITSTEINEYLKKASGADFSAKDFRTWNGTVLAAVALATSEIEPTSRAARKRAITRAVKRVAEYLGNTPAVCRASYIDPRVIDRYDSGITIADRLERIVGRGDPDEFPEREAIERAVLELLA